jgi:hypothetical protein
MIDLEQYIAELAAEWPPLTKEQIGVIATVLQSGGENPCRT